MSVLAPVQELVYRSRRGAELLLTLLALAVGIGAYAAVGLGVKETLPADMMGYSLWLAALAIAVRRLPGYATIPIVMTTEMPREPVPEGVTAVVSKPLRAQAVLAVLRAAGVQP